MHVAQETRLKISGMHCDACVRRVRLALEQVSGVTVKDVKVGEAIVEHEPAQADQATLRSTLSEQGFALESTSAVQ